MALSVASLRCIGCGAVTAQLGRSCRCATCGDLLEVDYGDSLANLSPQQGPAQWRSRRASMRPEDRSGVWRFRELLPIVEDVSRAVSLEEGNTPLIELPRCGAAIGVRHLAAKHQGMNPTGSFKDTGMTTAVTMAQAAGAEWLACASTGNTSASMAAYAARAGLRSLVLVPEGNTAPAKLAQALDYGAVVVQLRTDFDGCVRVLGELVERLPVWLVNSVNPYRLEGQKTAAIEIMEQRDWEPPDHIVMPGGYLANASALGKGVLELRQGNLIARLPRISIVQAEGANPLVHSWRQNGGRELKPVRAATRASAIRIGNPASWKKAVRVLRATGGECLDVSEEEIAAAKTQLGREGAACEPASAAALAGAAKLARSGFIRPDETVVLVLTGHGLKDPEYTLTELPALPSLEADAEAVERALGKLG
ncbi:MAG: threonine synthase [Terriglobales bacterium]